MPTFQSVLASSRCLLMDGAMGTELQRLGAQLGWECLELWNLTRPEVIRAIHHAYVEAGAEIVLTHTFQANPTALEFCGRADQLEAIWGAAFENARATPAWVLADIGPLRRREDAAKILPWILKADGILLETWSDPTQIISFAAEMRRLRIDLPLCVSFSFRRDETGLRTFTGATPEACAHSARLAGAVAVGMNCGADIGVVELIALAQRYRAITRLPILARPNAGSPTAQGYTLEPTEFAQAGLLLQKAGVRLLGGCCGTTPAHIQVLRDKLSQRIKAD